MKKELVIPLGITFIAGILIMLAGCGSSNPFNPLPNIFVNNVTDASGTSTPASFTINVYGPDIHVYSYTESQTNAGTTVTASATAQGFDVTHTQPNTGTSLATFTVSVSYTGMPAGRTTVQRVYSYYTLPGNQYGTFVATYGVVF